MKTPKDERVEPQFYERNRVSREQRNETANGLGNILSQVMVFAPTSVLILVPKNLKKKDIYYLDLKN